MSDKRVSEMSDNEVRALAGAAPGDPVAAELVTIRERNERSIEKLLLTEYSVSTSAYGDVRRLLAALDEVLKLPERWRDEAQSLRDTAGEVAMDYPDAPGIALKHARASGLDDAAKALEHYISRALLGEDGS